MKTEEEWLRLTLLVKEKDEEILYEYNVTKEDFNNSYLSFFSSIEHLSASISDKDGVQICEKEGKIRLTARRVKKNRFEERIIEIKMNKANRENEESKIEGLKE